MSNGVIAWVVAITLGLAVVVLGSRRNLADVTRSWLPRFGEAPESATTTPGLFHGGQDRRQISPRQRRVAIWSYLLFSLYNVAQALLSADDRLLHAASAALFAVGAVVFLLRKPSMRTTGSPTLPS
jgi:hypothetical protein